MSKPHIPATRNIYGSPKHLQVRVIRISAGVKSEYGKCFNFEKCNGTAEALAEATALRDRLVQQHPPYGGTRGESRSKKSTATLKASKYESEFAKGTRLYIQRYMRENNVSERIARRHFNSLMAGIG